MYKHAKFKKRKSTLIVATIIGIILLAFISERFIFSPKLTKPLPLESNPQYLNTNQSDEARIADLLSYMTLEEKVGQMALTEKNSLATTSDITTYALGALLSGAGAKPENNTKAGWRDMVADFQEASVNSRLGIPILYGIDAINGHGNVPGATIFPHFIGLGASHDPKLVEAVALATGEELEATGINWSYSPTYDMPEDIRWGRVYETFSTDPNLVGELGASYIKGLQNMSNTSNRTSVLATPKHYIGVGSMLWNSSSNKNFKIDQGETRGEETNLENIFLPPFAKAVDEGALSVMVGLNSWNGVKLAGEKTLITDILKEQLRFQGFVVSDWYGVYELPGSDYRASVTAINAGVDMVMLPFDYQDFIKNVTKAVRQGDISEERINDAVTRILRAKFALGLFDGNKNKADLSTIGSVSHRALAREAVAKSLVLLKNEQATLPLTKNQTILVAGSSADNTGKQAGAWTIEWQGVEGNNVPEATSLWTGLKLQAEKNGSEINLNPTVEFADRSRKVDVGIAIVGESPYAEGWGDNDNPTLSKADFATIKRLRSVSEKLVVVLVTGRPLIITDQITDWDAVVVAWLPGSEGAGVADVLFGKTPFTGSLPLSWPASLAQLPITTEELTKDNLPPLFPRGFGLSY